jgi:hypothetical protein
MMNIKSFTNKLFVRTAKPDSLPATRANKSMSMPDENLPKRIKLVLAMVFIAGSAVLAPAASFGQTSGATPTFNATVQGQSASTLEGSFANVVNYVGNVICPIGAGLMVAATVVQVRNGKSWAPTGITAMGLLGVSGITRLIESMVMNGQSAVN